MNEYLRRSSRNPTSANLASRAEGSLKEDCVAVILQIGCIDF